VQTLIFFGVMPAFSARSGRPRSATVRARPSLNATPQDIGEPVARWHDDHGFEVFHPHRVSHEPSTAAARMVFCTDHELRHGSDPSHPDEQRSWIAEGA
jgi:hypothetical protein